MADLILFLEILHPSLYSKLYFLKEVQALVFWIVLEAQINVGFIKSLVSRGDYQKLNKEQGQKHAAQFVGF